jgi:hypothetical protein
MIINVLSFIEKKRIIVIEWFKGFLEFGLEVGGRWES